MAQVLVVNRAGGGGSDLARRAFQCAPLLFFGIHRRRHSGARATDGFSVNAKFYVGDDGLSEQRVEAKDQLAADGFELLLPRRVRDGDDERLAIKAKGHGLSAQGFARNALPRGTGRRFDDFFRLTCCE